MKVVVLAVDLGTNLSEETNVDVDDLVEGFDCKGRMTVKQSVKISMVQYKKYNNFFIFINFNIGVAANSISGVNDVVVCNYYK